MTVKKSATGVLIATLLVFTITTILMGFQNCSKGGSAGDSGGAATVQQTVPVTGGTIGYQASIKAGMPSPVSVQFKNEDGSIRTEANGIFSLKDSQGLICTNNIQVVKGIGSGVIFVKGNDTQAPFITIDYNFVSQDPGNQFVPLATPKAFQFPIRDFTPERVLVSGLPPDSRSFHSAIYEPSGKRMLVFGGRRSTISSGAENNSQVLNDLWAYSPNLKQWSQISTTNTPSARYLHGSTYDSKRNRMLIFGGKNTSNTKLSEVWALDLTTLIWTQVTVTGTAPSPRAGSALYFDASADRLFVLAGGATGDNVWSIYFDSPNQGHWVKQSTTGAEPNTTIQGTYDVRSSIAFNPTTSNATLSPETLNSVSYAWTANASPYQGDNINGSLIFDPLNSQNVSLGGGCCLALNSTGSAGNYSTSDLILGVDGAVTFPIALHGHSAIYDPENLKMIVFGGEIVSKTASAPVTYSVSFINDIYAIPLPRKDCP